MIVNNGTSGRVLETTCDMSVMRRRRIYRLYAEMPLELLLYYVAFAIYVVGSFINQTTFSESGVPTGTIFKVVQIAASFCLAVKLLLQRCKVTSFLVAIVLIVLGFVSYINSGEGYLFWTFLFIVCGKDVDIRTLAKIVLYTVGPLLLFTMTAAQAGIIPTYYMAEAGERDVRSCMGFLHPNRLGQFLFTVCLATAVIDFRIRKHRTVMVSVLCFAVALFVCNSRTACAAIALVLVATVFTPVLVKHRKGFLFCSALICILVFSFSMFFMVSYDSNNRLMAELNEFFTTRLSLMHQAYKTYGISILGQECTGGPVVSYSLVTREPYYFYVDNVFAHCVIKLGLLPTLAFLALVGVCLFKARSSSELDAAVLGLMILMVLGLSSLDLLYIDCNYFAVAMAASLYDIPAIYANKVRIQPITRCKNMHYRNVTTKEV